MDEIRVPRVEGSLLCLSKLELLHDILWASQELSLSGCRVMRPDGLRMETETWRQSWHCLSHMVVGSSWTRGDAVAVSAMSGSWGNSSRSARRLR